MGVPPWVGLAGFLEQTPPFLLHLANRVVYENAFWLCAKINSACSLLGKEGVCVWGGVLGEKWAGHLLVTGRPGQGGHAEEEGPLCPASGVKIHSHQYPACPVSFALESGNPGFEFLSLTSKLGASPVSTAGL